MLYRVSPSIVGLDRRQGIGTLSKNRGIVYYDFDHFSIIFQRKDFYRRVCIPSRRERSQIVARAAPSQIVTSSEAYIVS